MKTSAYVPKSVLRDYIFRIMKLIRRAAMGILMLTPGAWLVRTARFGLRDGYLRIAAAYGLIAPFEDRRSRALEEDSRLLPLLNTIPEVGLEELVTGPGLVSLSPQLKLGEGSMPMTDLLPFLSLFSSIRPAQALEIGTFEGTTTAMMALNSPETLIHTLDLPPENRSGETLLDQDDFHLIQKRRLGDSFRLVPGARILQHHGDSASWDFRAVCEASFAFIDGAHTYAYIRNDTEKTLANCRKPLTVVWHDCDTYHAGVVRWLAEMVVSGHAVRRIRGTALAVLQVPG